MKQYTKPAIYVKEVRIQQIIAQSTIGLTSTQGDTESEILVKEENYSIW